MQDLTTPLIQPLVRVSFALMVNNAMVGVHVSRRDHVRRQEDRESFRDLT